MSHALEAICGVYADLGMVCRSAVEILSKQRTPRRLLCYSHHFSRDPSRSSGSHHNVTGERYDGVFKRGQKNGVGIWKHAAGVSRRRPSPARLPLAAASAR